MNERIKELWSQAEKEIKAEYDDESRRNRRVYSEIFLPKFAELIVQECLDKIETHRIPVGNSAAGELACEWTYAALKEIRDEIKELFAASRRLNY